MDSVALIAPDFSIILLGLLLRLKFDYSEDFWKQAERLVFYVLFPPLLFTSISGSSLSLGESAGFLAAGIGAMLIGVCASWCIRYLVKADPVTHASLFQCGFRFNTYIGFALALKLFGDQGFALLALLIAFWVPISNTIAVSALAGAVAKRDAALGEQTNGSKPSLMVVTGKAVAQNPLIIATVLGLCCNLLGITVPATIHHFLKGLGNASLAMGLLCSAARKLGTYSHRRRAKTDAFAACLMGSDGSLRTAAGSGGSRHSFCGSADSTVVLCDDGRYARQRAGCCRSNIPADISSNSDAAHLDFACDSLIQAIKKSRFRGSKILPTNNVCRQGKQNYC